MNYNNKKKYKKQKAKDRARKTKQARRSRAIKRANREEKEIEKLRWIHRDKIKPTRKTDE